MGCWRSKRFDELFLKGDEEEIEKILIYLVGLNDELIWYYDKNGEFYI